jgi:fructokinase
MSTPKVEVADTVGAGDAFTAAMIISILNGLPLEAVHQNAVDVSAFVASRNGGMPDLSEKILDRFISNN